ncbi:uncharacterized protein LOC143316222 [Chaetodon auriga]|uniref:uncharacterized protein LOC143316222 n=1 Tax=Chaetodon auriga TaxID=39042 RepID=UPI004032B4D3
MRSGLKLAFLLLVVTVMVKGSDQDDNDPNHGEALHRSKRRFSVYDILRGSGAPTVRPKPTKSIGGNGFGFNLEDALSPDAQTSRPGGGNSFGFNLEDAVRPAPKPTDGDCKSNVAQKLSSVIENQHEQLRLLLKLAARLK